MEQEIDVDAEADALAAEGEAMQDTIEREKEEESKWREEVAINENDRIESTLFEFLTSGWSFLKDPDCSNGL